MSITNSINPLIMSEIHIPKLYPPLPPINQKSSSTSPKNRNLLSLDVQKEPEINKITEIKKPSNYCHFILIFI